MKKLIIISGFILALLAVILSVTPLYNLALIPIIAAIICLAILIYIQKKTGSKTKFVQYIGILSLMALSLTIYKAIFASNEVENIEAFEQKEEDSVEDSIELLEDLEIDE